MVTLHRVHLQTSLVFSFLVHLSSPVCVDVGSDTEAVLGGTMRLTCISCLKREEMKGITTVEWYFTSKKPENNTSSKTKIFRRRNEDEWNEDEHFNGRLSWFGSKDMQNLSLQIQNVSERDHGFYECHVTREFDFGEFSHRAFTKKNFTLTVKEKASKDTTAIYSEIMMYVLLVFLTLWLLVEMVYCYRKISKSDEQAQDTATNYLAVPSEQKDNPVTSVTE